MTKDDFDSIAVGTPIEKVREIAGRPYKVKKVGSNQRIYIYIERFRAPTGIRYDRHYLIDVVDGRVKDKSYYVEGQSTIDYILDN